MQLTYVTALFLLLPLVSTDNVRQVVKVPAVSPRYVLPPRTVHAVRRTKVIARSIANGPEALIARAVGLKLETRFEVCVIDGQLPCTEFDGCCDITEVCGIYGGQEGCCPIGENCIGTAGCGDDVECDSGKCCPSGSTCSVDSFGTTICDDSSGGSDSESSESSSRSSVSSVVVSATVKSEGSTSTASASSSSSTSDTFSGGSCPVGYSGCLLSDNCCPTGTECIADNKCDVPCTSSDIMCDEGGCCPAGSVCTSDKTCSLSGSSSSGDFSSDIFPSSSFEFTSTSTSTTTTAESGSETESDFDINTTSSFFTGIGDSATRTSTSTSSEETSTGRTTRGPSPSFTLRSGGDATDTGLLPVGTGGVEREAAVNVIGAIAVGIVGMIGAL